MVGCITSQGLSLSDEFNKWDRYLVRHCSSKYIVQFITFTFSEHFKYCFSLVVRYEFGCGSCKILCSKVNPNIPSLVLWL